MSAARPRRYCRRILAATLAAALLLGAMAPAALADVSSQEEYAARVEEAYQLVSGSTTLVETSEEAQELADQVEALVPGSELVEHEGLTVDVDGAVASALTTELRTARTADARREAAERLAEHLGSLSAAAGDPAQETYPEDPEALTALLESAQEAEAPLLAELIQRVLEWLASILEGLDFEPTPGGRLLVQIVLWAVGIGLVALLVWLVLRAVRARRERPVVPDLQHAEDEAIVAAAEGLPDDPLSHADRLAEQGRFRDAVRALFGGAARELVRHGFVRQTRTLTNGELLRAVRRSHPAVLDPLRSLATDFEVAWYGHIDPDRTGYDVARERFRRVLALAGSEGRDSP